LISLFRSVSELSLITIRSETFTIPLYQNQTQRRNWEEQEQTGFFYSFIYHLISYVNIFYLIILFQLVHCLLQKIIKF